MNRWLVLLIASVLVSLTFGGPAKTDPVAPGLPAWQGVSPKNRILGRDLCPSDLRHKVTIVLEVEATDQLGGQLSSALPLVAMTQMRAEGGGGFGSTDDLPAHDVLLVVNCQGLKDRALVRSVFFPKKDAENAVDLKAFTEAQIPVYEDITFLGAPEIPSRPYVYVMGPLRTDPLFAEKFDEAAIAEVRSAITRGFGEMDREPWKPFYGHVANSKFHPQIAKAIEKQKPLSAVTKSVLAEVLAAKDPDEQQQMQKLFDALNQTRSELVHKIHLEADTQPLVALSDIQKLAKLWPMQKKLVDDVTTKFKAVPGLDKLGAIFAKVMVWADPNFKVKSEAEAKKIVAELTGIKKQMVKFKDSKVPQLAAAYQVADSKLDELISEIPSKVPGK